jgi:histone acetyltransferase (RNA polymerase elongator complex component)
MMIGLPGGTLKNELETAKKICAMGAMGARIYPTVVFYDTELADMAERGEYQPIALEDAIYRSKEVLKVFMEHDVECIRIGLCASDNLFDEEKVMGGANHAALGELVIGELYFDEMNELLALYGRFAEGRTARFSVPRGETSKVIPPRNGSS